MSPEVLAAQQALAARPITCRSDAECDALWSRAVQWVAQNGHYPVISQSDILVQTAGPRPNYAYSAYRLTRTAQADGTWRIELDAWCDNMFGCVPDQTTARAQLRQHLGM